MHNSMRSLLSKMNLAATIKIISKKNALRELGWFNSYDKKQSIDGNSLPIPWFTYSSIFFLDERLNNNLKVFEYGSGNSTLWFSDRVNFINSIEHDNHWYKTVTKSLKRSNVKVIYVPLSDVTKYINSCNQTNLKYDIIIIDGRHRVECIKSSIESLSITGIIILDNSNRENYTEAFTFLKETDFRYINFWGMCPGASILSCTTIFYRNNNCLSI